MIKYYCDNCNAELESEQDGYKLVLPAPEFLDSKNKTSSNFYLEEKFLCLECTQKLYNLIYNREKPFSLKL